MYYNPRPNYGGNSGTLPSVYDVKNYGARGDGTGNDAPAINSAIQDAYLNGGGIVYLPQGIYNITVTNTPTCIDLKSNVSLVGAGIGATTIRVDKNREVWFTHPIHLDEGVHDCYIGNFTLDGNMRERYFEGVYTEEHFQNGEEGISSDGHNIIIENMHFEGIISEAIDCDDGGKHIVNNVTFNNIGGNAIHFSDLDISKPAEVIISNFRINNAGHLRGKFDSYNNAGAITLRPNKLTMLNGVLIDCYRPFNIKNNNNPIMISNVISKGITEEMVRIMESSNTPPARISFNNCYFEYSTSDERPEHEIFLKDCNISFNNCVLPYLTKEKISYENTTLLLNNVDDGEGNYIV